MVAARLKTLNNKGPVSSSPTAWKKKARGPAAHSVAPASLAETKRIIDRLDSKSFSERSAGDDQSQSVSSPAGPDHPSSSAVSPGGRGAEGTSHVDQVYPLHHAAHRHDHRHGTNLSSLSSSSAARPAWRSRLDAVQVMAQNLLGQPPVSPTSTTRRGRRNRHGTAPAAVSVKTTKAADSTSPSAPGRAAPPGAAGDVESAPPSRRQESSPAGGMVDKIFPREAQRVPAQTNGDLSGDDEDGGTAPPTIFLSKPSPPGGRDTRQAPELQLPGVGTTTTACSSAPTFSTLPPGDSGGGVPASRNRFRPSFFTDKKTVKKPTLENMGSSVDDKINLLTGPNAASAIAEIRRTSFMGSQQRRNSLEDIVKIAEGESPEAMPTACTCRKKYPEYQFLTKTLSFYTFSGTFSIAPP